MKSLGNPEIWLITQAPQQRKQTASQTLSKTAKLQSLSDEKI